MSVVLETDRLVLRHMTWDDLDDLHAIMSNAEVMRYIGDGSPHTIEQVRHIITRAIIDEKHAWESDLLERLPQLKLAPQRGAHFSLWATVHKPDNRLIGRCGLLAWDVDGKKEVEVGYLLDKPYWGRGLGTEVARASRNHGFAKLGVDRLISVIQPGNLASQRVAIKNGMRYERDWTVRDIPVRIYSIERAPHAGL
jgi:ribosomal-protein-alanine N-acetyltransferase